MKETPVSLRCREILDKREHVLIGISPFNSYFSEENIKELINWTNANFKDFHLLIPDTLPYFNFLAIGYSHDKAISKTKRQVKYLLNKINRAFLSLSLDNIKNNKIIMVSNFAKNSTYCEIYNACLARYTNDADFKRKCQEASGYVLRGYTSDVSSHLLDIAAKYLLGELPFYLDSPRILSVDSSLLAYHEGIDFFVNLYKNNNSGFVAGNQGHLILNLNGVEYE